MKPSRPVWPLILICLSCLLFLAAGCAGTKPEADRVAAEPAHQTRYTPDVGVKPVAKNESPEKETEKKPAQDARKGILSFFGRKNDERKPGKVKLKNVTLVVGDNNKVAGDMKNKDGAYSWEGEAANAGKNAKQATDSATLNNSGGGALAAGANSRAEGGATVKEAPGWAAMLTQPVGYVLALLLVAGVAYGGYRYWQIRKAKQLIS